MLKHTYDTCVTAWASERRIGQKPKLCSTALCTDAHCKGSPCKALFGGRSHAEFRWDTLQRPSQGLKGRSKTLLKFTKVCCEASASDNLVCKVSQPAASDLNCISRAHAICFARAKERSQVAADSGKHSPGK